MMLNYQIKLGIEYLTAYLMLSIQTVEADGELAKTLILNYLEKLVQLKIPTEIHTHGLMVFLN